MSWGNLRQGNKTVSEYIQERERLAVLCDIDEPEEMKIGRFLGGLREEIKIKLEAVQNLTYKGACNSALVYEKYAKSKPNRDEISKMVRKANNTPKDVISFKCHGHGHYKSECPNARAFTQRECAEIQE